MTNSSKFQTDKIIITIITYHIIQLVIEMKYKETVKQEQPWPSGNALD